MDIRELYKVKKSAVKVSYEKHLGLKKKKEYEKWADETAIGNINKNTDVQLINAEGSTLAVDEVSIDKSGEIIKTIFKK